MARVSSRLELLCLLAQHPTAWVRVTVARHRDSVYWLCPRCAPETPLTFEGDVYLDFDPPPSATCEGWNDGWVCGKTVV